MSIDFVQIGRYLYIVCLRASIFIFLVVNFLIYKIRIMNVISKSRIKVEDISMNSCLV